jgi:DNA polymerase-3 subunit gamma/tau
VAEAELILEAADAIASEDGRAALLASDRLMRSGRDPAQFGRDLLAHLRQLLVIRTVGEVPDTFSVTAADPERLRTQAEAFSDLGLSRAIDTVAEALGAVKEGDEPRMTLELAILRAARPQLDPTRQALLQRIEKLEGLVEGSVGSRSGERFAATGPHAAPAAQKVPGPASRHSPQEDEPGDPDDPSPRSPTDPASSSAEDRAAASAVAVEERGELDFERIKGLWPAVLDQVRESGSELLSTVFAAARPLSVDAEQAVLKVGFPASAAFNKRKAEAEEARDRFADAVKAIAGERLRPVYVLLEEDGDGETSGPDERLSEEELIDRLKSEFDAEEFEETEKLDAEEAR